MPQLIVGTAGHIDHGKSRLVWSLTGTDPDRLPEEKARGMTLDLGFGHARVTDADIWFVDVPGHERFVRNMVAGATGVDAAMLVVAADDSVMPQTREHAELLALLGVERCLVVLTKMDLVDDEWAAQVELEVDELLENVGLRAWAHVRTSAADGRGLDELRAVLARLAAERAAQTQRDAARWFRLSVDRSFHVAGRGVVVTGSVAHGAVAKDEELELLPEGRRVRVRGLQSHKEDRLAVAGRLRLALNLAGVELSEAHRGCELATPGYLEPTQRLDVHLAWLRLPKRARAGRLSVRIHLATDELTGSLRLAEAPGPEVGVVRGAFGQLRAQRPLVAAWGQRFVLRDVGGTRTLGGGVVVNPMARTWTTRAPVTPESLERLRSGDTRTRLLESITRSGWVDAGNERLAGRVGLPGGDEVQRVLGQLTGGQHVVNWSAGGVRLLAATSLLQRVEEELVARLTAHLRANPHLPGVPRGEWTQWMPRACPARWRAALSDWLLTREALIDSRGFVTPRAHSGALPPDDQALLDQILAEMHAGGMQPPAADALACRTPRNARRIAALVELATARGELVRIAPGYWLHAAIHREVLARVRAALQERETLTVADLRDLLSSTRKYVVPFAEHLDATGVTRRDGDLRRAGPRAG